LQEFARERRQATFLSECAQGTSILSEEEVCWRTVPFLQDRGRQFGGISVAHPHIQSEFLTDPVEQRPDQRLGATRINSHDCTLGACHHGRCCAGRSCRSSCWGGRSRRSHACPGCCWCRRCGGRSRLGTPAGGKECPSSGEPESAEADKIAATHRLSFQSSSLSVSLRPASGDRLFGLGGHRRIPTSSVGIHSARSDGRLSRGAPSSLLLVVRMSDRRGRSYLGGWIPNRSRRSLRGSFIVEQCGEGRDGVESGADHPACG